MEISLQRERAMRRIVVSLLKGGVAKSETAVNLAHGLARRGYRVLLVDTDVQAQCNDMLGVEPEQGLAEVIAGWAEPLDVLVEARENLFLLAGGVPLAGVKMEIARREMAPEAVLDETMALYEGEFDVMVMDTAPGWDTLLVNALYCSREVISPVSMEPVALKGLRRFEERLAVIQKYNPDLKLKWILPTFVDGRVRKTAHIMEQLQAEFGPRLTDPIRYSVKLSEAPEFGRTIFEHDPRGAGAKGYNALVERVIREAPAMEPVRVETALRVETPEPAPAPAGSPPAPEEPTPAWEAHEASYAPPEWDGPRLDPPVETPPPETMPAPLPPLPLASATDTSAPPAPEPEARGESIPEPRELPAITTGQANALSPAEPPQTRESAPKVEEGSGKIWDLRERLKKVPVLSQRLKKGLNSVAN